MSTIEATPLKLRIVNYLQQQIHQIHQQGPLYSSAYNDIRVVDAHFHTNSWYLYIYIHSVKDVFFVQMRIGGGVWLWVVVQMISNAIFQPRVQTSSNSLRKSNFSPRWSRLGVMISGKRSTCRGMPDMAIFDQKTSKMAELRIEHAVFMVFQVYILYIYIEIMQISGDIPWIFMVNQWFFTNSKNCPFVILVLPLPANTSPFSFQKKRHRLYVHESTVRCHAPLVLPKGAKQWLDKLDTGCVGHWQRRVAKWTVVAFDTLLVDDELVRGSTALYIYR